MSTRGTLVTVGAVLAFVAAQSTGGPGNFLPRHVYDVGDPGHDMIHSVLGQDLNLDGCADIVSANSNSLTITVLYGQADRTFAGREDYAVRDHSYGLAAHDYNADGLVDLAVSSGYSPAWVSLYYAQTGGGFAWGEDLPAGYYPCELVTGHFNEDTLPDLIALNGLGNTISVFHALPGSGFAPRQDYPAGDYPLCVAAIDLDGDTRLDLVVGNHDGDDVIVMYGQPGGTFEARRRYWLGGSPIDIAASDFNGDGRPDVAVARALDDQVALLYGQPDGSLGGRADYDVCDAPTSLAAGDFDGDGLTDLAVASQHADSVRLLYGQAGGGFAVGSDYPVGETAWCVRAADFDGDGWLDLVAANTKQGAISVLYNALPEPATFGLLTLGGLALLRRRARGRGRQGGASSSVAGRPRSQGSDSGVPGKRALRTSKSAMCATVLLGALLAGLSPASALDWTREIIDPEPDVSYGHSVALASDGTPHVIYYVENTLRHAYRAQGAWHTETVDVFPQKGNRAGIAIDSRDRLHIAYSYRGVHGPQVCYGLFDAGMWKLEFANTYGVIKEQDPTLALDGNDDPHVISFVNSVGSYYAKREGDSWVIEAVGPTGLYSGFYCGDVAVDSTGTPHIAGRIGDYLYLATRGDGGWTLERVGRGGNGASIVFDDADRPMIGHVGLADDDLRFATKGAGGWSNEVLLNIGPHEWGPSLALTADGQPRMTFARDFDRSGRKIITHAYLEGSDWIFDAVDPEMPIGGCSSLAVDADGFSHVVYCVPSVGLRYATAFVPEPATLALLALGACVPVLRRKR